MLVAPNQSVFKGSIRAIHRSNDGWGANVDLLVIANESPTPERDFIRPAPGSVVTVFAADTDRVRVGEQVRVRANLAAGPFGGQAVAESLTQL